MLAALTLAVLLTSPSAQEATFERKVGDQTVKVAWPAAEPIPSFWPRLEKNGWSVAARPDGTITQPFMIDGKWADVRKVLESTADDPEAATWRVKVFVLGASDVLDTQPYLRRRFLGMLKPDLDRLNQSLALFAQSVEAKSRKRLKVQIDLEVDRETAYYTLSSADATPWGKAHVDYLIPRVNGHNFESDDRVYRGPYDSVFLIDGGPFDARSFFTLYGMPVSVASYFHHGGSANPGTFAETLVTEWVRHVGSHVNSGPPTEEPSLAYPVEGDLGWTSNHQMRWATKEAPLPIDGSQPTYARQGGEAVETRLDPNNLTSGKGWSVGLDASRHGHESLFVAGTGSEDQQVVGATRILEILNSHFKPQYQPAEGRPVAGLGNTAFKVAGALPKSEAELFNFPTLERSEPTAGLADLSKARPFGNASWEPADDPSAPGAMRFDFTGGSTIGGVTIWSDEGGASVWTSPAAQLRIKAVVSEPVDIVLKWRGLQPASRYRLFASAPAVAVADRETVPQLQSTLAADWQEIVVSTTNGEGYVLESISLENAPEARFLGSTGQKIDVVVASLTPSSATPTPERTRVPEFENSQPSDPNPMARVFWLKSVRAADALPQVLPLIADPDETVRLNAIDVFTRFEFAAAEKPLADALRTFNMRQVELALKALAHQNTESAWAVVQRALDIGPGDTTRMMAARELGKRGTRGNSGSFAVLFNSRSWRAREAAVLGLGELKTREASLMQIVFLQEVDPAVRLAVTRTADTSLDQVCRRLLWSCVNDTSDAVRAASYIRLLSGPIEAYRPEGYKGVRDESPFVRLEVLAYFAQNGNEAHRSALRIAVVDPDPRVRAAALAGFAALPGAVTIEEIGAAATDAHPAVRAAWLELKKAKGLPDPANPS